MDKPFRVLVVDDTEENLILISRFVGKLGHEAILARNGKEAVEQFKNTSPDLVLMDIMMPIMDGYEATRQIRRFTGDRWVPIIFLSALAQDTDHAKGLDIGGDDYLTKPINLMILAAKIRAMQRIADMQRKLALYTDELELYREDTENERILAKHLLERIIRLDQIDSRYISHWLSPAQDFSGDVIVTASGPSEILYVMVADATGHGLSAAINVLPVIEAFYGMTEKGFSVSSIVRELNHKIKMLMPADRFVAATIVALDLSANTLELWNGGSPEAFFMTDNGDVTRTFRSRHPALGILSDQMFDHGTEVFHWSDPGQIYMYSDGLVEATNEEGELFGVSAMMDLLRHTNREERFMTMVGAINRHMGYKPSHDDVSLVAINCNMEFVSAVTPPSPQPLQVMTNTSKSEWRLELTLGANEIKNLDILPMLMGWLDQLKLNHADRNQVFLILTELFTNAMDHGVLHLDSSTKQSPEGFESYMAQRSARLMQLQQAEITVGFERFHQDDGDFVQLHIKDSGPGFKYHDWLNQDISSSKMKSGRGISLVKNLCSHIQYMENGNEVIALYRTT